ncbi:MAG: GFA family protein [Gammaproteobacteria bacterium]
MIHGSCLCRKVQWTLDGAIERITHCHCQMCRKSHGGAFGSYAIGQSSAFSFTQGEDAVLARESSPGFIRAFCGTCGSVVPNNHLGDIVAMPAGGLDGELGVQPGAHIFAKWKAPWFEITDDLEQHDNYPGQNTPAVDRDLAPASSDGLVRGSCLCGDVAYEVSGEFSSVHNCHCSRCRKACAAAHATNGFTALKNLRFTRGREQIRTYHVADAKFFSQAFCRRCGSAMPQFLDSIDVAMVPFGSLDDDPSRNADDHIYVGSKSTWYPITDTLPQKE